LEDGAPESWFAPLAGVKSSLVVAADLAGYHKYFFALRPLNKRFHRYFKALFNATIAVLVPTTGIPVRILSLNEPFHQVLTTLPG
jgi:hypothetical protein